MKENIEFQTGELLKNSKRKEKDLSFQERGF